MSDRGDQQGLFTGYYEPLLYGSRHFGAPYTVPLHRAPEDMIRVDLGSFKPELAGETITGRVDDRQFVPYYARAEIDAGALEGREPRARLGRAIRSPSSSCRSRARARSSSTTAARIRVGYADQNGRAYRAIGRDLVEMGEMTIDQVSLQSIRDWLTAHPGQAGSVMARNGSYVFFDERIGLDPADGPIGAQGVPLTAGRSLAVDRRFIALGAPVWLDTTAPWPEGEGPLRRLMVAQDTGGAIQGPVRGDVFWGTGDPPRRSPGACAARAATSCCCPRRRPPRADACDPRRSGLAARSRDRVELGPVPKRRAFPIMSQPHVALFVTCLVDLFRPSVGFAAVKLLERAGCRVDVPRQTCCGQPAYNQGDRADAVAIARQTIAAFAGYDYVVAPSGSCAGMLKKHYPLLFDEASAEGAAARDLAARTYELISFLTDVRGVETVEASLAVRAPPTTIPARACASSASSSSRAGCSRASRGLELASCPTPRSAAASAARSASSIRRSRPGW